MTSQGSVADDNSTRETSGLNQIELDWQQRYPQFLDYGREPRPLNLRSLLFISAFFVVSWGLSTWQGLAHLSPAIATTTIVSIASLRASSFSRAYRQYLEQRDEAGALAGDAKSNGVVVPPAASSGCAPQWVLDAVTAAIAEKRLPEPTSPVHEKLEALAHATAILGDSWAHHLFVLRWDRYELLVAQPAVQKIDELMIQELWDFVDTVDGDYLICRNSENLSSETFRILIAQSPEVIDRYQWTIPAADIVG
jgi:hypothetical protein